MLLLGTRRSCSPQPHPNPKRTPRPSHRGTGSLARAGYRPSPDRKQGVKKDSSRRYVPNDGENSFFESVCASLRRMPDVQRWLIHPCQRVLGPASYRNHLFRLQDVKKCSKHGIVRSDLAKSGRSDRHRLSLLMRMVGKAIPGEEVREEGLQDAPVDIRAVFGPRCIGLARPFSENREGRV